MHGPEPSKIIAIASSVAIVTRVGSVKVTLQADLDFIPKAMSGASKVNLRLKYASAATTATIIVMVDLLPQIIGITVTAVH